MAINATRLSFVIGCVVLCCLAYYYEKEVGIYLKRVPDTVKAFQNNFNRRTNITDLFVQPGQKYQENNGVIYNCLSGDVFGTVPKVTTTRNFAATVGTVKEQEDSKRQGAFQKIFETRAWIPQPEKTSINDKMSPEYRASGTGSSLQAAQPPLALLNSLIDRLKIYLNQPVITIVDIPCGDFYWMKELVGQRSDVKYTGIDIVPTLIDRHKKNYRYMKNAQFMHMDIVQSRLNESYDIIFSRDMLQHLKFKDVMQVLDHFSSSRSKLLVTTQLEAKKNTDIANGGYRDLNLMESPVDLVPPICIIPDKHGNSVKHLGIWTLPLKQKNI